MGLGFRVYKEVSTSIRATRGTFSKSPKSATRDTHVADDQHGAADQDHMATPLVGEKV